MSTPQSENTSRPEQDGNGWTETESLNSIDVQVDAVGDTTIRPMRSPVLRQIRPDQPPPISQDPERP